ncbi:hypothetical protein MP228_007349 [Amoeboaphelidium protococcarum]|nr:hypothetical protein MP228_007349 [Amoeboaphelidium protococcarum]
MHFIISDQVGLLKELTITEPNKSKGDSKAGLVAQKQAASYGQVDRDMEITSMHRSFDTLKNQIFLGRKSGDIDVFDIDSKVIQPIQMDKQCKSKVISLYHHDDQQRLIVLRQSGEFSISAVGEHLQISTLFSKNLGQDLCALDVCTSQSSPNLVVYGGKERDVTVFDFEAQDTCFKGKNVAHDWLDMRVPLHHTAVKFMPNSDQEIVTCTQQGTVKLYDMRQDRRPVLTEAVGGKDIALKRLSIVGGNNSDFHNQRREILVCDNVGDVYHYDLGERRVIGKLKGSSGAIYDAQTFTDSSDNQMLKVATVGLDRFLRVYDLKRRTLLHKVYMKQRMNQVIPIIEMSNLQNEHEQSGDHVDRDIDGSELQYSDLGSDNDDVWEQLEVVNEKVKKKRTQ